MSYPPDEGSNNINGTCDFPSYRCHENESQHVSSCEQGNHCYDQVLINTVTASRLEYCEINARKMEMQGNERERSGKVPNSSAENTKKTT